MIMITCWILWMPCGAAPPGPGEVAAGLRCAVALSARTAPRASAAPAATGRRSLIPHSRYLVVHRARGNALGAGRGGNAPPYQPATGALPTVGQAPGTNPANHGNRAAGPRRSSALRAPGAGFAGCPEPESYAASGVP